MGVTTHTCNAIIWKGEAGKVVQSMIGFSRCKVAA